jgi:hypothetical protein
VINLQSLPYDRGGRSEKEIADICFKGIKAVIGGRFDSFNKKVTLLLLIILVGDWTQGYYG